MKDLLDEILKYQGLIQLPSKKPNPIPMFAVKYIVCPECRAETKHEYCKDADYEYWRCQNCLDIQLHKYGIFIPPHRKGHSVHQRHSIQEIKRIFGNTK